MKVLATLLLLASLCVAQIPENQKSNGALNGRYWTAQTAQNRLDFIVGYAEAWMALASIEFPKEFPDKIPYGELVAGINQFYATPENLVIPIYRAISLWTMKANGADPAKYADAVAMYIRAFRQASK